MQSGRDSVECSSDVVVVVELPEPVEQTKTLD